jgi:DNA-binding transcriptional ArsR family regulator
MPLTQVQIKKIRHTVNDTSKKLPTLFDALSDPTRCRIFRLLLVAKDHEVNVTDIAHVIGVSIQAISQHLKILEHAQLVEKDKKGQMNFYKIKDKDPVVNAIIEIMKKD